MSANEVVAEPQAPNMQILTKERCEQLPHHPLQLVSVGLKSLHYGWQGLVSGALAAIKAVQLSVKGSFNLHRSESFTQAAFRMPCVQPETAIKQSNTSS